MDLREHFLIIWRRRWFVLAVSVIVAGAVYGLTRIQHPTWQAQAELSVTPGESSATAGNGQSDALFLASTYAQLATTRPVISDAVRRSGLRIDATTAAERLTVTASTTVGFLTISAKGPTSGAAVDLAAGETDALVAAVTAQQSAALASQLSTVQARINQVTSQLKDTITGTSASIALGTQLQSLYQAVATAESQPSDRLAVVAPAQAGTSPVSPTPKRDAALAFVTALVIASEAAVGLEALGDRFPADRLDDEIFRITGLPVFAHVPEGSAEDVVEAFRTVRTNLLFLESGQSTRTVAIVSADPAAGKSFSAINLAVSVAELRVPVVLVDGDMRRPVVHERLSLPRSPGLADVLRGREVTGTLRGTQDMDNLRVLPAGDPVADPPGLLANELKSRVLDPMALVPTLAELVLIDTPAESVFPDAITIAAHADATIVVVDARHTRRRALRATISRLRQVGARPLGVVVNRVAATSVSACYYRNRYRSEPAALK